MIKNKGPNSNKRRKKKQPNIPSTGKKLLFPLIIAVFTITQVLLFAINFNRWFFRDTQEFPGVTGNSQLLTGHIFFTGDTFGKYGLVGCDRLGSISRRAKVLKKFDDYLYMDFGNFTVDNDVTNKAVVPILLKAYGYMDLKVMNLIKRDLLNLATANFHIKEILELPLVSANLHLEAPRQPPDSKENIRESEQVIAAHRLIPLQLKNREDTKLIIVGITGISNNERKLHKNKINFKIKDTRQSLARVMPFLEKADLKILLFNETFFELKKLLADGSIRFDLVIAYPTLPEHINGYTYIKNTPVVFPDEYGRSLGHARVCKINGDYSFEFDWYKLGMGIPRDQQMKTLTSMILQRIDNSKHRKNNREQDFPGNR
jgi:hypothetical protein